MGHKAKASWLRWILVLGVVLWAVACGTDSARDPGSVPPVAVAAEALGWNPTAPRLIAPDGAASALFGGAVAVSGDTAIVGAAKQGGHGAAYVFERDAGGAWTLQAELTGKYASNDSFGDSVAISGDTALVGAPLTDAPAVDSGAAYVFVRSSSGVWIEQAMLVAQSGSGGSVVSDGAVGDHFGGAVALAGNTALVSAAFKDTPATDAGAAYVYLRTGTTWSLQARLAAATPGAGDEFGAAVALDGDTALVGASHRDDAGLTDSGAAYVFVRNGAGAWSEKTPRLNADIPQASALFGYAVALEGDTAIVGSPYRDTTSHGNVGAAYVFARNPATGTFGAPVVLFGDVTVGGDHFGCSVAISGSTAVVGALYHGTSNAGAAYVFGPGAASGSWALKATLTAADGAANDNLGYAVAVSGDTTVCGAPRVDTPTLDAGAAYVSVNTCATDSDCPSGSYCSSSARCLPRKAQATGCDVAADCKVSGCRVCSTGFCADGVCCDAACTGDCQGCSRARKGGATEDGHCYFAADGASPRASAACVADPHCGLDGKCGANGTCRYAIQGTPCGAAGTCDDTLNQMHGYACNGSNLCLSVAAGVPCAPYRCANGACQTTCGSDADCSLDGYCDPQGDCQYQGQPGVACAGPTECRSGFCVDGVCCNTPCNEICQACTTALKGSGSDGYCGAARSGPPPHQDDCADGRADVAAGGGGDPLSCKQNGRCGGGGQCEIYAPSTPCGASLCVGSLMKSQTCNGLGLCVVESGGVDCGAYRCFAGACLVGCASDGDCAPNAFCQPVPAGGAGGDGGGGGSGGSASSSSGAGDGSGGGDAGAPRTGKCVPRQALGAPCASTSQCQSGFCADGVCCNTPCSGVCQACRIALTGLSKDGICDNVFAGLDPHDNCPDEDAQNLCGRDGTCNGNGACRLYPASKPCSAAHCVGDVVQSQHCSGLGACVTDAMDCAPYACTNGKCPKNCASDAACTAATYCDPAKHCVPRQALGTPCAPPPSTALTSQCQSGFCVDGVCCDTPCAGPCQACTSALKGLGTDGICENAAAGTNPHDSCPDDTLAEPPNFCGRNGTCNEYGGCWLPDYGTSVAGTICVLQLKYGKVCNGLGSAIPDANSFGDGGGGEDCGAFLCVNDAQKGASCPKTCTEDAECVTGAHCSPTDHTCKGFAECSSAGDSTQILADGSTASCGAYRCNAGACLQVCTSVDDCAASYVCDGNKCVSPSVIPAPTAETGSCSTGAAGTSRAGTPGLMLLTAALLLLRRRHQTLRNPS
jgi:hypothetical protein